VIDEDDGVSRCTRFGEFDGQVAGGDAIAGPEGRNFVDALAVDEGAVLAVQVLDRPFVVGTLEGQVLARKAGVVGIAELVGAGAAERDFVAVERDGDGFAVDISDDKFARS